MKRNTHIANVLEAAGEKARYDAEVKKILSDKQILSWILKYGAKEFRKYSIETIMDSIEGKPEVAEVPVYPGKSKRKMASGEAITGLSTEDKVPNEGEVTYDIRFYVMTPTKERVKIIVNLEAQGNFYPGYDLVTRAVFYCARMLSAQLDTEFTPKDYDDIKKVYSIWICLNAPDYAANTITEYSMNQKKIQGNFSGKARYDLLSAVMICLGKEKSSKTENKSGRLQRMLATLLSSEIPAEEKEEILSKKFGIVTSVEMKEEMRDMCNLSDLIEEEAIEKGICQGRKQEREQMAKLTKRLLADSRQDDLLRATEDEEFREALCREYGI